MIKDNIVAEKSMDFAIRIVKLYKYLQSEQGETVMSKQILRSGTGIGANIREGLYAQSRNDFISKLSIALKEAVETEYWLELLSKTGYLREEEYASMRSDCSEVSRLLTAIVKSTKK